MDPFKVLPLTFVIENGLNDLEFDKFEKHFHQIASLAGGTKFNPNSESGEEENKDAEK